MGVRWSIFAIVDMVAVVVGVEEGEETAEVRELLGLAGVAWELPPLRVCLVEGPVAGNGCL